ncbi:MAG: hypothetical protein L6V93_12650 [Clostridiales bacterium]|nr:MAG: hypothetical protein L6V93_12650 [Clostridiales bacterium]
MDKKIIEGMTIYKDTELKNISRTGNVSQYSDSEKKNNWLCVTAEKVRDIMSKSNGISACGNEPDLPRKRDI